MSGTPDLQTLVESDFVRCKLCSTLFTSPLLLPCLHTVCTPCLQSHLTGGSRTKTKMMTEDESSEKDDQREGNTEKICEKERTEKGEGVKTTFKCPECQTTIPTPKNGIASFQDNYFLMALVDLAMSHKQTHHECDYCRYDNMSVAATSCCLECHDNLCQSCMDAHRRTKLTRHHQVILYTDIPSGKHDAAIRAHQRLFCKKHTDQPVRFYCDTCDTITCGECKLHDHAKHNCSEVTATGESYKTQTKKTLTSIKNKIPSIRDNIQFLADYDVYVQEMHGKCKQSVENQAAMLHKLIDKYKDGLIKKLQQACYNEHDMVTKRSNDLNAILYIFTSTSEYLSVLLELGKPEEVLGARRIVKDRLTQLACLQLNRGGDRLCLRFTPGSTSKPSLEMVFGKADLLNLPLDKDTMTSITTDQAHIYDVMPSVGTTVELVRSFECHTPNDEKEVWPSGVDVDEEGNMYILDRENKKIKVYDSTGGFVREFGHDGDNLLSSPFDLTVLGTGEVAVTDYNKEDVKIFSVEGEFRRSISEGVNKPRGITTNRDGNILILNGSTRSLTTLDPVSGDILSTTPDKNGNTHDLFKDPYYVTTNQSNYVIVSDWAAPNIRIIDSQGHMLTQNRAPLSRSEQVPQPYGICTDKLGYIFVADHKTHRVHLLAPDGRFIRAVVSRDHDVWHPVAVAIDNPGHLVVTEALGKVKVFRYI